MFFYNIVRVLFVFVTTKDFSKYHSLQLQADSCRYVCVYCVKLVPWLKEMLSSLQMVLSRPSSQQSATHRQAVSTNESAQSAELLAADINKKKVKTKKI